MRAVRLGACGHGFVRIRICGIMGFSGFFGRFWARPYPSWRGFLLCEKRGLGGERFVRIRIYGIIGFSGFFGRFWGASVSVLAGFPFMAKRAVGRQRNPENPANPENPDSDKNARANHNARRPMDSRFRGNDGVESGIDGASTAHSSPMPTNH